MAGTSPGDGAEEVTSGQGSPAVDAPAAAPPPAPAKQVPHTAASKPAPATGQSRSAAAIAGEPRSGRRKVREGIVASSAMDKTAVVLVVEQVRHARYAKTVQRTKRLYAHDEANDVKVGDRVRLAETRPLSKLKRWRVEQVLERAR